MQYNFKDCRVLQIQVSLQKQSDNDMQSAKQAVILDLQSSSVKPFMFCDICSHSDNWNGTYYFSHNRKEYDFALLQTMFIAGFKLGAVWLVNPLGKRKMKWLVSNMSDKINQ